MLRDSYVVPGIAREADPEQIREAFPRSAKRPHPDACAGTDAEVLRELNDAYPTLSDAFPLTIYPGTANGDCRTVLLARRRRVLNIFWALRCVVWASCTTQVPGGLICGGWQLFEALSARCSGRKRAGRKRLTTL